MSAIPVWDFLPEGVGHVRSYSQGIDMVQCTHAPEYRLTYITGGIFCRVCKGDAQTTENFSLPVKMQVKLTKGVKVPSKLTSQPVQEALF